MNTILAVMVEDDSVSDTRFKLEEAQYFFEQMKKNTDNRNHFIFNLIAFVSAARSVTFVMQHQYNIDKSEKPDSIWYREKVQEVLGEDNNVKFFNTLRVKFVHNEGNPRSQLLTTVTKTLIVRYNIIGPNSENEEQKLTEPNPQQELLPTITDELEAQDSHQRYVWYIPDLKGNPKKYDQSVIGSCDEYLKRLSKLVDECEKRFDRSVKRQVRQ